MIKAAIDRILELAQPATFIAANEIEYFTSTRSPVLFPLADPLVVHTLGGVIDWIKSKDEKTPLLHVSHENRVELLSNLFVDTRQREEFLVAQPVNNAAFDFKHYMEIEEFVIQLQCRMVDTPAKAKLIKYLASIKGEAVTTAKDDGITQEVAVENKIGRLETAKMDPVVKLRPYRTFLEIEQPESPFLFRLKSQGSNLPLAALFAMDGGAWRNEAIASIASFFREHEAIKEKGIAVIE